MSRNFTPKSYPSLVALTHQCVLHAPNGLDAYDIAPLAGYEGDSAYSTMMAELTQPGRKFDADRLLPVMDATNSDAPMHFLARYRNGVFFRLPRGTRSLVPVHQQCLIAIKEFGELVSATSGALLDGRITKEERDAIKKEGYEALAAIVALLHQVEAECEGSHD